jgi:outer membrane protein
MMHSIKKTVLVAFSALLMAGTAAAAQAVEKEDFLFRLRGIGVIPDEGGSTSIGGSPEIDNQVVPEFDITYFFTPNLAAELILAVTPHDASVERTALGNVDIGSVWLLPPTLTLQYHFRPDAQFRPYVGAGVNYTVFFNEEEDNPVINNIEYDSSFGGALQVGFDYGINKNWAWNVDVKKVWINTDVSINNGAVRGDVDIDPWIVGTGIAYRF